MQITKYNVQLCQTCYRLTGYVEETYNGTVPVQCFCDLKDGKRVNPAIMGGVGPGGRVFCIWKPISDHLDENGRSWPTSYIVGMGFIHGNPSHQKAFDRWAKKHMVES